MLQFAINNTRCRSKTDKDKENTSIPEDKEPDQSIVNERLKPWNKSFIQFWEEKRRKQKKKQHMKREELKSKNIYLQFKQIVVM